MTNDQNTIANNTQTETIVKKILTSEVKYVIGIFIFLAGVVAPYYDIKQEIALIKANHYAHIEAMTKQIEDNSNEIADVKKVEVELMKTLSAQNAQIMLLENIKTK